MSFFSCFLGKSSPTPAPIPAKSNPLPKPVEKKTDHQAAAISSQPQAKSIQPHVIQRATPQQERNLDAKINQLRDAEKTLSNAKSNIAKLRTEELADMQEALTFFPQIEQKLDRTCPEQASYFKELTLIKNQIEKRVVELKQPPQNAANEDLARKKIDVALENLETLELTIPIEVTLRTALEQFSSSVKALKLQAGSKPSNQVEELFADAAELIDTFSSIRKNLLDPVKQSEMADEAKRQNLTTEISDLEDIGHEILNQLQKAIT